MGVDARREVRRVRGGSGGPWREGRTKEVVGGGVGLRGL